MAFAEPRFDLSEEDVDERTHLIAVAGEIHVSTAPEFSRLLSAAIGRGKTQVVLDLSDVEFIDSTGLSVLLNGLRRVTRRGGRMAIVCSNPTVLRLFVITRLDSTFTIVGSRRAALEVVSEEDPGSGGGPEAPARGRTAGAPQRTRHSGSATDPSSRWPCSSSAIIHRPIATAVPLSVWSTSGRFAPAARWRTSRRRAWKSVVFEHDVTSR